ncbi:pilus assembly protein [Massilia sp. S19_KUP03_FR1]|uniref:pilus assembly protein n=1 Tax=Massilia sp. S19_KUP03_FR1 TaxID=3025503 RepID=UPI002FCDB7BD
MKMNFINITRACSLVLAFVLAPGAAVAGVTNIAQLPLLSMDDTGAVKPNLMLLYDNSGSMARNFTPDYIDDGTTCRSQLLMASGTRSCLAGMPPFNSADFNRQYYDPKVRYLPPVKADGVSYKSQNRANTTAWTAVLNDGFDVDTADLAGGTASKSISLVNGFPDITWCDKDNGNCAYNTATYSYPNDTRYNAGRFYTNAYYYNINVAEYCSDATLTSCKTTSVGGVAPDGFPVPAKVRWCDTTALTKCQAKFVGNYKYPRFSTPNSDTVAAYGTITIKASKTATALYVDSVSVAESSGTKVITNGAILASAGTNDPTKQAALANAIAASIIAKTGLTNQYTACTRTPTGSVPNCSTAFGINLGADNIVAVVPIECVTGANSKSIGQCSVLADATRNNWAVSVEARAGVANDGKAATAILSLTGTGKNSPKTTLGATSLGSTLLFSSVTFNASSTSADAAKSIAKAINDRKVAGLSAIWGGQTGCTATGDKTVCISSTLDYAAGQKFVFPNPIFGNNGTLDISGTNSVAGNAPTPDVIPADTTNIGAGSAIFVRVDIVPERISYPRATGRNDCVAGTCTYDEEMTNFANWYTYYKSRNQTMKTAVGLAFKPLTDSYNVGLVSLSVAGAGGSITRPLPFSGDVRTNWYAQLYGMTVSGSTPLRKALHNVGKMYANQGKYEAAVNEEAVQFPCQQNFTFMTTDGYWNGDPADAVVADNDKTENPTRFCLKGSGCVDASGKNSKSLADVALYWYNGGSATGVSSLRPTLEDMTQEGKVRGPNGDNKRLHMNTYTLGLGVDGIMNYEENYNTAPISGGDFSKLINGVTTGCPWNNNKAYVWPDAVTDDNDGGAGYQSRVDDLWHTAINGRGKYFSASDPTQVIAGLSAALSNIAAHVGAASSAATSTPNISVEDNDIFSSTFTTVQWSGELTAQKIDVVTGDIGVTPTWSTSNLLGKKVAASTDTRVIKMLDTAGGTLKNFDYGVMTVLEKSWFDNKCSALSQCLNLTSTNATTVNSGATIINWLRGQQQYADDVILRAYGKSKTDATTPVILGDIASSKPVYVRVPRKSYANAGYSEFVTAQAARVPTVYVAANDGMLHAIDANTGTENWAYVPRITMQKLYKQAGLTYGANHHFTTDGSPEVGDVQINGVWKSVLVAGLNAGGRGYYALDVTDPQKPVALWETCADSTICTGDNTEAEMGQTFGNPVTGTWKDANGATKWVVFVTSGYNNVPGTDGVAGAGSGKGYLMILDIATGKVLAKTSTESGDKSTPSGLARITAISADPSTDPMVTFIYGGDILGQMWRFDLTKKGAPTVVKMGDAGTLQPITARPDVTYCKVTTEADDGSVTNTNKLMVAFGTGRLLDIGDVANIDKQSVYVLRDSATGISAPLWRSSSMAKRTLTRSSVSGADVYKSGGDTVDLNTQLGWYADFDQNKGERVNLDPRINAGYLNVVTNIPASSNSCSVGGKSNLYNFDVCDGTGNADGVVGKSLSSTSAAVGFIVVTLPNGTKVIYTSLADGGKLRDDSGDKKDAIKRRTGWRRIRN